MTSCPWPRRNGWMDRLRDWWTPPTRQLIKRAASEPNVDETGFLETVMHGGFWMS
ncbi:hypothetical protein [Synechococcus sp. CC9616]|uniref:hypothetical protein n=1 Tax=Synechococcus sp. CC9616 TaxID=110663 RepID=UPI001E377AFC|nr:hypothetical protein [Synechococcus sp. CC9616]